MRRGLGRGHLRCQRVHAHGGVHPDHKGQKKVQINMQEVLRARRVVRNFLKPESVTQPLVTWRKKFVTVSSSILLLF